MKRMYTIVCLMLCLLFAQEMRAQKSVSVNLKVTDMENRPLKNVMYRIDNKGGKTDANGIGNLQLSQGNYTIQLSLIGYASTTTSIEVIPSMSSLSFKMEEKQTRTEDVTVYGASRRQQKITEAPAAISVVLPKELAMANSHGQVAKTIEAIQGVDVVQSGMNDFNVNMRGFNNSINRRVLVLLDGRDPSTPLLNLVEWNSFQTNMGDIASIEVVRGPGSALYGSNAYNGVINITSSAPKDIQGTRVSLTGGDYNTFRGDIRHAGGIGSLYYNVLFYID